MGMSGLEKRTKSNTVTILAKHNCRLKEDTNNGMKVYTLLIFYFFLSPEELFLKIVMI